jgi:Met-zincin/Domain of unknown function (DUF5117)
MDRIRASYRMPLVVAAALVALSANPGLAKKEKAEPEAPDALAAKVAGLDKREGLLTYYLDAKAGQVWLELPAAGPGGVIGEYLYVEGLATGLGSNPIGFDRGQLGNGRVVRLRRLGNRVLLEEPNLAFRALSDRSEEVAATRESFAPSVLWAGKIEAEAADGRALVDWTSFLVSDAHGVTERLTEMGEGSFQLDRERSAVDFEACWAFPDNLELEAVLTYGGSKPGRELRRTLQTADSFSLVQHHSLIRLPDPGYTPRNFDPRAGSFDVSFQDYASPLDEPLERHWIVRHRLQNGSGEAPSLVYYVDPGIPEPVRSAVIEGASWWADAFAAAGFPGAFRVELLPEGAHPLDVRYNVIEWVHRSTRGWSYGGGIIDPRTGEMLKGHVSLGSLRVRQDRLIFEGLLGTEATGSGAPNDPVQLALARIRQLAAHEVGHTLGLNHNFAASTYGRASVMDYPAPLIEPAADGGLDASQAYAVGIGAWDIEAVRYAYSEFASPEAESRGLAEMIRGWLSHGFVMMSDADARPPGAAEPVASLWDNGTDAAERLNVEMEVRRRALARFGERNVAPGRPLATLEEVLATVYFHHRYQLDAAVKAVGGRHYRYAMRGDGQEGVTALPADLQRRALDAVLATLAPTELDLPESVLTQIHPRPTSYGPNPELIGGTTDPVFDPLAAASTAADLSISGLLRWERAGRLVDQHRRDAQLPSLDELLERLVAAVFTTPATERTAEIARAVQDVTVGRMIELAASPSAGPGVAPRVEAALSALRTHLAQPAGAKSEGTAEVAHRQALARQISRFLERPALPAGASVPPPEAPPGSPIGGFGLAQEDQAPWLRASGLRVPTLGGCSLESNSEPGFRMGHGAGAL